MEPVPVRGHRFQQVRVDQHLEGVFGRVSGTPSTRRRRGGRDRGALPQAEQAEREGRVDALLVRCWGQAGEAHPEAGPDGEVARARISSSLRCSFGEPPSHRPDGPAAAGDQPGRADPDGQRQASAQASSSSAVASGSAAARSPHPPPDEQLQRLVVVEHVPGSEPASVLAGSGIRLRVVTSTADESGPGSSGRTWAASRALSSTTSIRRQGRSVVRHLGRALVLVHRDDPGRPPRDRAGALAGTSPGRSGDRGRSAEQVET